jgi:hypothetical protein
MTARVMTGLATTGRGMTGRVTIVLVMTARVMIGVMTVRVVRVGTMIVVPAGMTGGTSGPVGRAATATGCPGGGRLFRGGGASRAVEAGTSAGMSGSRSSGCPSPTR